MKIFSFVLLCAATLGRAVQAQDCTSSYLASKGAVVELTEYEANNQLKGKQVYTVSSTGKTATGVQSVLALVKTDNTGTVTEQKTMHYTCDQQGVQWGQGANDAKTKTEAVLNYPANMTSGQELKTQLEINMSGKTPEGKNAQVNIKVKNRKVVGTDKVTLKAGSWTCTKITYDFIFRLKLGPIGLPLECTVTEWYAPEVGVVRSQTFMKGKLASYTEITALRK
jgi:hypothetical protein